MILRIQDYRGHIYRGDTAMCLLTSANMVLSNFGSTEFILGTLQVKWGRVRLKVYANGRGLNWERWGMAIKGLTEFVTTYEFEDMDFYIVIDGQVIAGGLLSDH